MSMQNLNLIEKITSLPPERINEIEDFVDFLTEKESSQKDSVSETVNLSNLGITPDEAAEQRAALSSFAGDWERPEMEVYDRL